MPRNDKIKYNFFFFFGKNIGEHKKQRALRNFLKIFKEKKLTT